VSKHVWDTVKFKPRSLDTGADAVACCVKNGIEFDLALAFIGYTLEKLRQEGYGRTSWIARSDYQEAVKAIYLQVLRSRHRYSKGKNATNYRLAGRRMLEALAGRYGLENNPPAEVVWDWIREPTK
jgi:hypothetical protein